LIHFYKRCFMSFLWPSVATQATYFVRKVASFL